MKKVSTILICAINISCFLIILFMIVLVKIWPQGYTGNKFLDYFLNYISPQMIWEDANWTQKYPYDDSMVDKYLKFVEMKEKNMEIFCTKFIQDREPIADSVNYVNQNILLYDLETIDDEVADKLYVQENVKSVLNFNDELADRDIPFFFVLTPSKDSVSYYRDGGKSTKIVNRSRFFADGLIENGIDLLYIAPQHSENITYDVSTHWKPWDAINCTRLMAEKIGHKLKCDIDLKIWDEDNFYDLLAEYENVKKEIFDNNGYTYEVPVPYKKYNITLEYAENEVWSGDFIDSLIHSPDEWVTEYAAYHNIYRIRNSLIYSIHNEDAFMNAKLLIIGDSFNWPVSSYLSLGISDIDVIYNAGFPGSILNYIEQKNPDLVVMVYNDAEFYDMYNNEAFNLK
ncbi:MAG: hypothetical protein MJ133_01380 [Lachnospiraceae bacterium]|nr:hypothetical protein [Lachnospiraceae bacterium]